VFFFLAEHDKGRRPGAKGCTGGGFNRLQRRPDDVHKSGYVWVFDKKGAQQEAGYAEENVGIVSRTGRFTQERRGGTARVKEIGGFDPRVYGGGFSRKDREKHGVLGDQRVRTVVSNVGGGLVGGFDCWCRNTR
jgi:hypothetical protein